jgi:branched-chain amino acid aminotransferase
MKVLNELLPVEKLGFGQYFAPLKAISNYSNGKWSPTEYSADLSINLGLGAKVLHYAQEIFEGMKAFRQEDGSVAFFRPQANWARLNYSARLMAMPEFSESEFMFIINKMAKELDHLVPAKPGALYFRPTMIGISEYLGVASSEDFIFFVLASPAGGYFKDVSTDKPVSVKIKVSDKYTRAAPGGTGSAKTGGNYAASLRAILEAKNEGFSNVLFLDAREKTFIEELGGMNFFVVDQGTLKTPPLGDTILAGVTRDSILRLAKTLDIPVSEEQLSVFEMAQKIKDGRITEAFACGTAATISSISELGWKGEKLKLSSGIEAGPVSTILYKTLIDIQHGNIKAPESNWIYTVR